MPGHRLRHQARTADRSGRGHAAPIARATSQGAKAVRLPQGATRSASRIYTAVGPMGEPSHGIRELSLCAHHFVLAGTAETHPVPY